MKSIAALARIHSMKVSLKIMAAFSLVLLTCFSGFLAYEASTGMGTVFQSIEQNLSQSLQIGDGFQVRKLLGSLTESKTVEGAAVVDSFGDLVAKTGMVILAKPGITIFQTKVHCCPV